LNDINMVRICSAFKISYSEAVGTLSTAALFTVIPSLLTILRYNTGSIISLYSIVGIVTPGQVFDIPLIRKGELVQT